MRRWFLALCDYAWVVMTIVANGLLRPPQRRKRRGLGVDPQAPYKASLLRQTADETDAFLHTAAIDQSMSSQKRSRSGSGRS